VAERAVTIAQALNVPVLIASQVNVSREEGRNDTVKRGYTFRESAKLEHKASVVLIFDRRRDLNPDSEQQAPEGDTVEMKLMCFKNRLGPQFKTIELLWDKPLYRVRSGPWPSKFADETPEDFRVVGPGAPVGGVSDTLFEMNGD
jgi:replicative DNA helicase